jgi:hypothetical protein
MDLLAKTMELLTEQVGGFYSPASETFYLMRSFTGDAARIILAHELCHALDDQHFDLDLGFERIFPNINIFGYTLLPGTEFYERREEYAIETIPVAGYGKAKGEYVVGCHTFDRDEGIEGYFLITAHIVLIRGYVMPLTTRYLALEGSVPVSALLRAVLRGLVEEFARDVPGLDPERRMDVYESRAELYLAMLSRLPDCFAVIRRVVDGWLGEHAADPALSARVARVLELDHAFCPRVGRAHDFSAAFAFPAARVRATLERMELPAPEAFEGGADRLAIHHPAHVGEVLKDPDGGSWMRGQLRSEAAAAEPEAPVAAE